MKKTRPPVDCERTLALLVTEAFALLTLNERWQMESVALREWLTRADQALTQYTETRNQS